MQSVPQHIAVIMDGNGRWAKRRHLPRLAGHKAGEKALRKVIQYAAEKKVAVLSLFAFSTENWSRPQDEVDSLMSLFLSALKNESKKLHENNIQLRIVGDTSAFSSDIKDQIQKAEALTKDNTGMKLVIAANYGGRWDITNAVKKIAAKVKSGELCEADVGEDLLQQHLVMADLPEPDLLIRTSGELRLSNFFLWQLAYSELYFTDTYWPDFNEAEFEKALEAFANRERRFGHAKTISEA